MIPAITPEIQGIFSKSAPQGRFRHSFHLQNQSVAGEFPAQWNREYFRHNRERISNNREYQGSLQVAEFEGIPVLVGREQLLRFLGLVETSENTHSTAARFCRHGRNLLLSCGMVVASRSLTVINQRLIETVERVRCERRTPSA